MSNYFTQWIKPATKREIAMYNKVNAVITDEIFDLLCEEDLDNLVDNKIKNPKILAWLKIVNITAKELCTWYFID